MKGNKIFSVRNGVSFIGKIVHKKKKPLLIVVSGGTCSGKTYIAQKLAVMIDSFGLSQVVIECDRYFLDIDDPQLPRTENGYPSFDEPLAYHNNQYMEDVFNLLKGKSVFLPKYDMRKNKRVVGENEEIKSRDVIIIDGLYALTFLSPWAQINCYIETGDDVRLSRRIERDTNF